ncbi:hypothetical protein ACHAWF_005137 [Thalassiosira exigua]
MVLRQASSSLVRPCQRLSCNAVHQSRFGRPGTVQVQISRPTNRALNSALAKPLTARSMHRVRPLHDVRRNSNSCLASSKTSTCRGTASIALPCTTQSYLPRRPSNVASASHSIASASAASEPGASQSQSQSDKKSEQSKGDKSKKDDSNIFLDNLGKIFLSTIGLILAMLLRSTKSNNSRTALREDVESTALLDPLEIDDLRLANADFTVEVWEKVAERVKAEFPDRDEVSYPEFLSVATRAMEEAKGEGFGVQLGHLVDRVVIAELERARTKREGDGEGGGDLSRTELPLPFLFAALSLALHGAVSDRVRVLYESMPREMDASSEPKVSGERVARMIQHLQSTCQLVPDAQIVETDSKVPYQTYRVGTGEELTKRAREGYGGKKGSAGVTKDPEGPVSLEEFHAILKSKTVCAWGECYVKKAGKSSTSDR